MSHPLGEAPQRLRVAIVAPPWYLVPPGGYGVRRAAVVRKRYQA